MAVSIEFSTITEMFDRLTKKFANERRPLLMYKSEGHYKSIGYTELQGMVEQFAAGLASLGVKHGDHIAIISENHPEWVIADLAMMSLGAVNISIYPTLAPKQIEFIFKDAGVRFAVISNQLQFNKILKILPDLKELEKIIIFTPKGIEERSDVVSYDKVMQLGKEFQKKSPSYVAEQSTKVKPDDLLTLIYTSGTTGNPKGVMLTHRNLVSNMVASADVIPFNHNDTLLSFLPLCHSYERMAGYYTAMACGATIAYAESVETVRDNLVEVKPTIVTTVPRLFERIHSRLMKQVSSEPAAKQKIFHWALDVGYKYSRRSRNGRVPVSLQLKHAVADKLVFRKIKERTGGRIRFFVSGGAALPKALGEFFDAIGIRIIEGYGMTESSPVISVNRPDNFKFGSVGHPIPDVQVRIAEDGEILVKGPNVMKGYWNNPVATRESIDEDGWLHTGDIGKFDEEGFLVITDRKKHLFVSSGGKNIAPQPIENLFAESRFMDQFVLIGDGRMYLTALVVPDFDILKEYARSKGVSYRSDEDLAGHPEIYKLFDEEIARIQRDLANYERVRKFTILPKPFTVESGEITPTQKVKRKVVEEKYRDAIERMYQGVA